jgi:hypothetical protein
VKTLDSLPAFYGTRGFITASTRALHFRTNPVLISPTCLYKTDLNVVRFEVFTAVARKNVIFWYDILCGSCKKRVSEERITTFIRVTIDEPETTLAVTSNRSTLRAEI